jgi:hypothetical protein
MGNFDVLLNQIYYIDGNYDGINNLYKKARKLNKTISKDDVSQWLKDQDVTQLTKSVKPIGKELLKPIYSNGPYDFQIDLTFLPRYKNTNDKNYVMFTGINVNTRYAYAYYGKNKETSTIIKFLDDFLDNCLECDTITLDSGSEFTNKEVMGWFDKHKIKLFFVVGDSHRLGIINRFHRTLKDKIEKYIIAKNTTRWIDILPTIIKNYNNTEHRGISNFTPKQASNGMVMYYLINKSITKSEKIDKIQHYNFEVGDMCRIVLDKGLFDKSDRINFSTDVYKIVKIHNNSCDVENDNSILKGIKNKYIQIVKNYKKINLDNIVNVVKENKVIRLLKKEDIVDEAIIRVKRDVKKVNKLNL